MSEPAWGSAPRDRVYAPEKGAPPPEPEIRMFSSGEPPELGAVHRRARTALIVHAVLIFFASVLSIPGAVFAALALGERHDPRRARHLLRWSWGFLAATLLFYVLLVVTVVVIVVFVLLAATK